MLRTLALSLLVPALVAQAPQPAHRVEKVAEGIYTVFGRGGNVGLVVGAKHCLLVDSQYEASLPGLLAAIKTVTDKPIGFLVNTHHHGDHVGGNALLAKSGVTIIAHTNARKRLAAGPAALPEAQRDGLPVLALGEADPRAQARADFHLDGLELHFAHFGPGHTDNDLAVGIPSQKVIHLGDLFFRGMLPFIDTEAGGSFDGLVAQLDAMLAWLPADSRIIPGHGPLATRPDLARYVTFLKAVQAHARTGKAPAELAATFDKAPWEGEWKPTPTFVTWETLFQAATGKGPGRVKR